MNLLVALDCGPEGTLLFGVGRSIRLPVMDRIVNAFPDQFLSPITRHLQQSFIAERDVVVDVDPAKALDNRIKDELQFRLEFARGLIE